MKYILIAFLLVGCAMKPRVVPKKVEVEKDIHKGHIPRHQRLLNCVDRYVAKDIKIHEAFTVCKGIYKRG